MTKVLDYISSTKFIIASLVFMLIIGAAFSYAPQLVGGELLDLQMNAMDAGARLSEMSNLHKSNHIWITLILDGLYPLAYGGFLAGITARFAKPWRKYAVIPSVATILIDFAENFVQVLALAGSENALFLKNTLTSLKFGGFFLAALLALVFLIIAVFKWVRRKYN